MPEKYEEQHVTVDIIILACKDTSSGWLSIQSSDILLIKRKNGPFKNFRALPGGYVNAKETLEQAAYRELQEETSLSKKELKYCLFYPNYQLQQFKTYGDPERDPRGRIISVVFSAFLADSHKLRKSVKAMDDAKDAQWFPIKKIPKKMAFDHTGILNEFKNFWRV
jgi:ADP-ribose pyrophosphatase